MEKDIFVFNLLDQAYRSNQSLFDSLVYREIADFNFEPQKLQIQ